MLQVPFHNFCHLMGPVKHAFSIAAFALWHSSPYDLAATHMLDFLESYEDLVLPPTTQSRMRWSLKMLVLAVLMGIGCDARFLFLLCSVFIFCLMLVHVCVCLVSKK